AESDCTAREQRAVVTDGYDQPIKAPSRSTCCRKPGTRGVGLTIDRPFDRGWCVPNAFGICAPCPQRLHRGILHCRCMKSWKLSLSLCMENCRRIIQRPTNAKRGSKLSGLPFID